MITSPTKLINSTEAHAVWTVAHHLGDYVLFEKLKSENGGIQNRLSVTQTMQFIESLPEKTFVHTRQIVTYVETELGVNYTVAGMNK